MGRKFVIYYLFILVSMQAMAEKLPLVSVQSAIIKKVSSETGESKKRRFPKLSALWRAGDFLIYDCLEKSYICVDKNSFLKCQRRRDESQSLKESLLSCAPLNTYDGYENCLKAQYNFIHRVTDKRFCRNYSVL